MTDRPSSRTPSSFGNYHRGCEVRYLSIPCSCTRVRIDRVFFPRSCSFFAGSLLPNSLSFSFLVFTLFPHPAVQARKEGRTISSLASALNQILRRIADHWRFTLCSTTSSSMRAETGPTAVHRAALCLPRTNTDQAASGHAQSPAHRYVRPPPPSERAGRRAELTPLTRSNGPLYSPSSRLHASAGACSA